MINPNLYNIEVKHTEDSDYQLYAETISQQFAQSQAIRLANDTDINGTGKPLYGVRVVKVSTGEVIIDIEGNHPRGETTHCDCEWEIEACDPSCDCYCHEEPTE